jgi:hypothetical protein
MAFRGKHVRHGGGRDSQEEERRGGEMRQAWRWYGPDDPVTLDHVRQAGAHEIVTALHQFAPGEVWLQKAVAERIAMRHSNQH